MKSKQYKFEKWAKAHLFPILLLSEPDANEELSDADLVNIKKRLVAKDTQVIWNGLPIYANPF